MADRYGVSKQRIFQIYRRHTTKRQRAYERLDKVIYPNIRRFMADHLISYTDMAAACDVSVNTLTNTLFGKHKPQQKTADGILFVVGMTYEEAFRKRKIPPGAATPNGNEEADTHSLHL